MMVPMNKPAEPPFHASPRQAARRRGSLDRALDPEFFKALADPTRVRLLACIAKCGRGCSVSEVAECCSVDFSVVARHLAHLARAGVLESERRGRTVVYTARSAALAERFGAIAGAFADWSPRCCGEDCCE
ncbi:MAG: ArsR/SmtB family transcription factor [Phycisphaerales bacterium JB037]